MRITQSQRQANEPPPHRCSYQEFCHACPNTCPTLSTERSCKQDLDRPPHGHREHHQQQHHRHLTRIGHSHAPTRPNIPRMASLIFPLRPSTHGKPLFADTLRQLSYRRTQTRQRSTSQPTPPSPRRPRRNSDQPSQHPHTAISLRQL